MKEINLTWKADGTIDHYNVYRSDKIININALPIARATKVLNKAYDDIYYGSSNVLYYVISSNYKDEEKFSVLFKIDFGEDWNSGGSGNNRGGLNYAVVQSESPFAHFPRFVLNIDGTTDVIIDTSAERRIWVNGLVLQSYIFKDVLIIFSSKLKEGNTYVKELVFISLSPTKKDIIVEDIYKTSPLFVNQSKIDQEKINLQVINKNKLSFEIVGETKEESYELLQDEQEDDLFTILNLGTKSKHLVDYVESEGKYSVLVEEADKIFVDLNSIDLSKNFQGFVFTANEGIFKLNYTGVPQIVVTASIDPIPNKHIGHTAEVVLNTTGKIKSIRWVLDDPTLATFDETTQTLVFRKLGILKVTAIVNNDIQAHVLINIVPLVLAPYNLQLETIPL